jgi:hypothetical protein
MSRSEPAKEDVFVPKADPRLVKQMKLKQDKGPEIPEDDTPAWKKNMMTKKTVSSGSLYQTNPDPNAPADVFGDTTPDWQKKLKDKKVDPGSPTPIFNPTAPSLSAEEDVPDWQRKLKVKTDKRAEIIHGRIAEVDATPEWSDLALKKTESARGIVSSAPRSDYVSSDAAGTMISTESQMGVKDLASFESKFKSPRKTEESAEPGWLNRSKSLLVQQEQKAKEQRDKDDRERAERKKRLEEMERNRRGAEGGESASFDLPPPQRVSMSQLPALQSEIVEDQ